VVEWTQKKSGTRLSLPTLTRVGGLGPWLPPFGNREGGASLDKTVTLTDALDQTGCKERGVQSVSFNCTFNVANGPQTLLILPDIDFSGHKKATVGANTVKCVERCELLSAPVNP
jgi:hypothetical protein